MVSKNIKSKPVKSKANPTRERNRKVYEFQYCDRCKVYEIDDQTCRHCHRSLVTLYCRNFEIIPHSPENYISDLSEETS